MKHLIITLTTAFIAAGPAAAQAYTGEHRGTVWPANLARPGTAAQANTGASMDDVTTRNVAELMNQIRTMLRQTVQIMGKSRHLDQDGTRTMSEIMARLSSQLRAMSQGMNRGTMDRAHMFHLQQHMNRIGKLIRSMEQQAGI